jgi:hypothetical protein
VKKKLIKQRLQVYTGNLEISTRDITEAEPDIFSSDMIRVSHFTLTACVLGRSFLKGS